MAVLDLNAIKKALGERFNPAARYSVYGSAIRGHGPAEGAAKVGEIRTTNDTLSIYENLPPAEPVQPAPEAPKASTTKEPTRARRQPVRR